MKIEVGKEFGNYRIVSKLGAGGMGEVFLADDMRLDRKVAIKFLSEELGKDSDKLSRFMQEAKAASALNHPNIITVFEIGGSDDTHYIATEFIDGITLRELLDTKGISLVGALDVILQIADALAAAHNAGIIHRDIKPENVMIRHDGRIKVLDFGLAKLSSGSLDSVEATRAHFVTRSGVIVGTVAYMSPEQARARQIDTRSDIFSLGILMFELFTRRRPFSGETTLELVSSILKDEPPLLREVEPEMPERLESIVTKTLRKDREQRYQDIRDLRTDIEDLRDEIKFDERALKIQRTASLAQQDTRPSNIGSFLRSAFNTNITETRRFTLLHAMVFVAVAGAIIGAIWYLRPGAVPKQSQVKISEVASWMSAPGELGATANYSPDGKLIAFASTRSGTKDIWVTQATSTEAIQITRDGFLNTQPIWSPTGDEIAYISLRPGSTSGNSMALWRISALGGGVPKSIADLPNGAELVQWGRSGRIYYTHNNIEIFAIETAGGNPQRVCSLPNERSTLLGIATDEKSIAFITKGEGRWSAHTADLDGANQREIATGEGDFLGGGARPTELDKLFFSVSGSSGSQIMSLDLRTGDTRVLATPETTNRVVAAQPDGKSLLLSSAREEADLWRVDVESSNKTSLARDLNVKIWPAISPDNTKVVYQSIKNLNSGDKLFKGSILLRTLSGGESENPTVLSEQGFLPKWSPDGATISLLKQSGSDVNLFVVNSSGGGERQLTTAGVEWAGYSQSPYNLVQSSAYTWSPDSTRIGHIAKRDGTFGLWIVNLTDNSQNLLTAATDGSFFFCPIFSPDGRQIAFSYRKKDKDASGKVVRGLMSIDLSANELKRILETTKIIRLIGWNADGSSLIAAEASQDNVGLPPETNLLAISLATGSETRIANLKNAYFYNIFLSEDRKQIAFTTRNRSLDNIWVVPTMGGTARQVTNNADSGHYYSRVAWTRDGRSIVFGEQTRYSLLSKMTDIE